MSIYHSGYTDTKKLHDETDEEEAGRAGDYVSAEEHQRIHLKEASHQIEELVRERRNSRDQNGPEGIILEHAKTGQQLFVVHGHQADWTSNNLFIFSKFVVRLLWRQMRRLGVAKVNVEWINPLHRTPNEGKLVQRIEDRLSSWAARQHQTIVCGHTHIPHLPVRGMPAYLNTGHCMAPGIVTGLEIRDGQVWPVKWMVRGDRGRERHLWTTPRLLTDLTG